MKLFWWFNKFYVTIHSDDLGSLLGFVLHVNNLWCFLGLFRFDCFSKTLKKKIYFLLFPKFEMEFQFVFFLPFCVVGYIIPYISHILFLVLFYKPSKKQWWWVFYCVISVSLRFLIAFFCLVFFLCGFYLYFLSNGVMTMEFEFH